MDDEGRNRERFAELAPWHANGTLSPADRAWVDDYVRTHPKAAAELAWYASLQQRIREDVPEVPADVGLERLMHRIHLEPVRRSRAQPNGVASLLGSARAWLASLVMRPAFAYAASALVVVQAGLIGTLLFEQAATERAYAEYRSIATVPAEGPLLRVSFRPDAKEADIRSALVDVGGTLAGGPGQLGEYVVRVPAERIEAAAATLRANAAVEAVEVSPPAPRTPAK